MKKAPVYDRQTGRRINSPQPENAISRLQRAFEQAKQNKVRFFQIETNAHGVADVIKTAEEHEVKAIIVPVDPGSDFDSVIAIREAVYDRVPEGVTVAFVIVGCETEEETHRVERMVKDMSPGTPHYESPTPAQYDAEGKIRLTMATFNKGYQESDELNPNDVRQHPNESDSDYDVRFVRNLEGQLNELVRRGLMVETENGAFTLTDLGLEFLKTYPNAMSETESTITLATNISAAMDDFALTKGKVN